MSSCFLIWGGSGSPVTTLTAVHYLFSGSLTDASEPSWAGTLNVYRVNSQYRLQYMEYLYFCPLHLKGEMISYAWLPTIYKTGLIGSKSGELQWAVRQHHMYTIQSGYLDDAH